MWKMMTCDIFQEPGNTAEEEENLGASLNLPAAGTIKIGLALGSGSARGWAHLGVIQALEEAGVQPVVVAGTSIGAVVAAFYAADRIQALREFALSLDRRGVLAFFDPVFPRSGFLEGKKLADFFTDQLEAETFDKLSHPLAVVATDLRSGTEIVIQEGPLIPALRASISIPGILAPVKLGDYLLVDGGLVNPVPVDVARRLGADIVIAVNLNVNLLEKRLGRKTGEKRRRFTAFEKNILRDLVPKRLKDTAAADFLRRFWTTKGKGTEEQPNILEIMNTSLNVMEERIARINLAVNPPDILLQPPLGHLRLLDFDRAEEAIAAGYEVMRRQLPRLQSLLEAKDVT